MPVRHRKTTPNRTRRRVAEDRAEYSAVLPGKQEPLWNQKLDGFGNHDPGAGRYNQQRSPWDVIHPGRPWAARLKPNSRSKAEILKSLSESLE
jgi:hypothetical protein